MRKLVGVAILFLLWLPQFALGQQTAATAKAVRATNSFVSSLDAGQRKRVLYAFTDEAQRARWSNFPIRMAPRGGISLKEMTPAQREAATAMLAAVLSSRGLEKVQQIMEGDEVNQTTDRRPGGRGGPLPGAENQPMFGRDLYFISILGTPSETDPWMLQFGGHHLALNITIAGSRGILTPTLTGAQPALFTLNGKTVRPLGNESDKGFALLQSLDADQRKKAVLGYRLADLVLGPGQDGKTIMPEGLQGSSMTAQQRALMLDVMREWAGIMNDSATADRMRELEADLAETWFAWSGPVTATPGSNITAYYRIQGPHVVIEYAPQELGGDAALHVHTMYRDPTNDYGVKSAAKK